MAVVVQQHHINALTTPTWFLVNVTPPPVPREGGSRKAALISYSPLLLSPAGWQSAQDEKKGNKDANANGGGLPASPRITCMGQVKGRKRRSKGCSSASARGRPATPRGSRNRSAGGTVADLLLGLFGMRRNARTTSRACAKVRDVPRAGTASASAPGSTRGARRGVAVAAVGVFDPPLPVVKRPAADDLAPSLWERRRGRGRALEGLQLMTQIAAAAC